MQSKSIKQKAIEYRKRGYSYNMIAQRLGLAKSTLSNWLKEMPFRPNKEVIQRVSSGRLRSAITKNKQKIDNIAEMRQVAKKELGNITKRDLWLLGIGLYLGEGSKVYENVRVINSDPQIIKIIMKWFREVCDLANENFKLSVHLYPDSNIKKSLDYWSKITNVNISQFGKTQIDRRLNKSAKKKHMLPHGTLHITIKSWGNKNFGVSLHRRIIGWIEAAEKQL